MQLEPNIVSKIIQSLVLLSPYKVILCGSYAKGTATEDSDIDLVVILDTDKFAKNFKERTNRDLSVSLALLEINRLYAMDIIVYSKGEFEYLNKIGDFFVKEIEETGINIYEKRI